MAIGRATKTFRYTAVQSSGSIGEITSACAEVQRVSRGLELSDLTAVARLPEPTQRPLGRSRLSLFSAREFGSGAAQSDLAKYRQCSTRKTALWDMR